MKCKLVVLMESRLLSQHIVKEYRYSNDIDLFNYRKRVEYSDSSKIIISFFKWIVHLN